MWRVVSAIAIRRSLCSLPGHCLEATGPPETTSPLEATTLDIPISLRSSVRSHRADTSKTRSPSRGHRQTPSTPPPTVLRRDVIHVTTPRGQEEASVPTGTVLTNVKAANALLRSARSCLKDHRLRSRSGSAQQKIPVKYPCVTSHE